MIAVVLHLCKQLNARDGKHSVNANLRQFCYLQLNPHSIYVEHNLNQFTSMQSYYAPDRREGGNKRCFCPSICPSVCLSVRRVAYIANNLRTQRPSVPKFGMKVPHLVCDLHTSFKNKRSKVRVTDGRGHTVSAEPGGHTACLPLLWHR